MRRPSSSIVKRWTLKTTLCLLAGAVATWAVAWGCALWPAISVITSGEEPAGWPLKVPSDWATPGAGTRQQSTTWTTRSWVVRRGDWNDSVALYDYGLPLRSMRITWAAPATSPGIPIINTQMKVPSWLGVRSVPLEILPLGFAVGTLLYGGVVLGVVEGVGFARRRRRIAKNRCPSCDYDRRGLAGDAPCPECGGKA